MKAKLFLVLLTMCLLSSGGCALSYNLLRTTVVQPKQFCSYWDKRHQQKYFRKVARQELERARATARAESDDYTCDPYSQDEVCGFEDGFVDYVMYGGNGNPPLPPRRYWKSISANGYQAIQDWYNGFRHGASVAQASGYRDCVTIQLSDGLNTTTLPTYIGQRSGIGYIDSYGPLLSEKNAQEPASSLAGNPDLANSMAESDEAWPIPKTNFSAAEKQKPETVQFPISKSPTSPSIYPDNRVEPGISSAQSDRVLSDSERSLPSDENPEPETVHFPIVKSPASPSIFPDNRVEPRISSAKSDKKLSDSERSLPSDVNPEPEAIHIPIIKSPVEPRISSVQSDKKLSDSERSLPSDVNPELEAIHIPIIKSPASPSIYPDNRVQPRISSAPSDQELPDSETSLPSDVNPKPEAVHFPIIKSPASPSIYRDNHAVPLSQSGPRFSKGVDPSSPTGTADPTGVQLASASEPESPQSSASPIPTQFSFESLPPLSASPDLPGEVRPVSIPPTQAAPIKRLPAKLESSMFEPQPSSGSEGEHALMSWLAPVSEIEAEALQTSLPGVEQVPAEKALLDKSIPHSDAVAPGDPTLEPFSEVEGVSQQKITDVASKQKSGVQRLWPIIAGVALLLAGIIYLVRRRPRTAALALSQLRNFYQRTWRHRWPRSESRLPTMPATHQEEYTVRKQGRVSTRAKIGMMIAMMGCLASGCASLTNPVLNGIPVRKLPTELLSAPNRDRLQTIPLSLLRQKQPEDYILAAGDVIGVFVAGVFPLTSPDQPLPSPPVYFPSQIDPLGAGLPPSLGYPVTIRNDGTLSLPLVDPIMVGGLTLEEANSKIRESYLDKGILQPGREAVLVTLMQRRQIRVLVFRQEVGGFSAGGRGDISGNNIKQGTGHLVDLRAYENDVVTALANTGGLPGLDAFDGVFIFRGGQSNAALVEALPSLEPEEQLKSLSELGVVVDYIPTRWAAGEPLPFEPEDAILHEGDVVLLESRVNDFFYTGGLLPSGQQVLPRDYDLDVVEAVAQVNGTLVNGAFGGNNFNGLLIQQGIGNPNPSALTVIRRTPDGGQIPISVDLNRALVDARERILIRPNDVLILQETGWEAIARYFGNAINFSVTIFDSGDGAATAVQGN